MTDLFGRLRSPRKRVMSDRHVQLLQMLLDRGSQKLLRFINKRQTLSRQKSAKSGDTRFILSSRVAGYRDQTAADKVDYYPFHQPGMADTNYRKRILQTGKRNAESKGPRIPIVLGSRNGDHRLPIRVSSRRVADVIRTGGAGGVAGLSGLAQLLFTAAGRWSWRFIGSTSGDRVKAATGSGLPSLQSEHSRY